MCLCFGGGEKLNIMGISKIESINTPITLMDAIIPNSVKIELFVIIKVENPEAVVKLVSKVAFPTFWITLCNAFILFPCCLYSWWYLFKRKIQLGIPITIINGGIIAESIVISKPNKIIEPKAQTTPVDTTSIEKKVTLNDLKNE